MQPIQRDHRRTSLLAIAIASTLVAAVGCATSASQSPSRLERGANGSFTITQDVRVGLGVRSDFEAAIRLLEEDDAAGAVEHLREVTEAAPGVVAAHIDLGIAYGRLGDWQQAEASLVRAVELAPHHPVALNELGMALRRQGRFEEARASYEKALEHAPAFHFARRNLAILCDLYLDDAVCALDHYERYAEALPGDADVAMWIADLRNRLARAAR